MEAAPRYFTSIDGASDKHDACVIEAAGTVKARSVIAHTADGLIDLIRRLKRFDEPARLPIAIERPSWIPVDTLVVAGFPVVPIHRGYPPTRGISKRQYHNNVKQMVLRKVLTRNVVPGLHIT
ncbi:MAG: IS110 family transposase [Longimicrobiales bacterium]